MSQTITVPPLTQPTRLDKFLVSQLPTLSRHLLQQNIKQGLITVNNKKATPHHWLKKDDVINYPLLVNKPKTTLQPNPNVKWELIKDTVDYLIINKPSGLTTHPASGVTEPTLIEGVVAKYPDLKTVGEDALRPGIVHRLDKEASGLMVVAKNQAMFEHLKNAFQERKVAKEYSALVIGQMHQPSGTINFSISRSKNNRTKMAAQAANQTGGKEAVTHFTVVKQYQAVCLISVTIATGRTHQIRTHLNSYGHPLVGDPIYRPKNLSFKNNPGRLFLHATKLGFFDLLNNWQEFVSPLPLELQDFLKQLS
ncbi:RluA family pseudouridine synthase [Patescibacteria group bacterium]|nr:RluA family pseudouridine synthase [Patescibacteria group bacterium]